MDISDEFSKALGEEQIAQYFEKYLIIGCRADTGGEYLTNCNQEQLALMLRLFSEIYKGNE